MNEQPTPETDEIEATEAWSGIERRSAIDPSRTRLTIPEKAALIAISRFKGTSPTTGMENEKFTEDCRGGYGIKFRRAVQDVLHRMEAPELIAAIEVQYDSALAVWTDSYPVNVEDVPSKADLSKWLSTLSPKTLCGLKTLGADTLVLVPPMKAQQLMEVLDANKKDVSTKDVLNDWPQFWNNVGTDKWKFGITNVEQEVGIKLYSDFEAYRRGPVEKIIRDIYYPGMSEEIMIRAAMAANLPKGKREEDIFESLEDDSFVTFDHIVEEFKRIFAMMGVSIMPAHGYIAAFATKSTREVTDDYTDNCMNIYTDTLFEKPMGTIRHKFPIAGSGLSSDDGSPLCLAGLEDHAPDHKDMRKYGCRPWIES